MTGDAAPVTEIPAAAGKPLGAQSAAADATVRRVLRRAQAVPVAAFQSSV